MYSSKFPQSVVYSLVLFFCSFSAGPAAIAGEASGAADQPTLYERLGAWNGIAAIVNDTIANHLRNPDIAGHFQGVDLELLAQRVTAFFAAGSGGPNRYEGRDMTAAHQHMNLSDADFDAAVADVMKALNENEIGATEQGEVKAILESLRGVVLGQQTASSNGQ